MRGAAPAPDADLAQQRAIVDTFQSAAREGGFEALLALLAPEVVLRVDAGAEAGGGVQALTFRENAPFARPVLVNGAVGMVAMRHGEPFSLLAFTVRKGVIVAIDILADPVRVAALDLPFSGANAGG